MPSDFQPRPSGGRRGVRKSMPGGMQFMTERETQAYLIARDTIRRVQRTSSLFERGLNDAAHPSGAVDGRNRHH